MATTPQPTAELVLDADAPVEAFSDDKFSFGPLARGIARQLIKYDRPTTFSVGINGPWGSGKTSLINLVRRTLEQEGGEGARNPRVVILPFSPWIVGNRESLLRQLLPTLEARLRKAVPPERRTRSFHKGLRALRKYKRAVTGVEQGLSIGVATATLVGIPVAPFLAPLAGVVGSIGKLFGRNQTDQTLDDLRSDTQQALSKAAIRIAIIFDDLDRLEPKEILEIARMVRSTLDLPHITFILSYDRGRVASSVAQELGVDGDEYLEKIIQLPVEIPRVSGFELAQLLATGLNPVLGDLPQSVNDRAGSAIWSDARDLFLSTPRDVGRLINTVSFAWVMLKSEINAADLIFTRAMSLKSPNLFNWVHAYLFTYHIDNSRLINVEPLRAEFEQRLATACSEDGLPVERVRRALSRYLPGFREAFLDEARLFGAWSIQDAHLATQERRLASAQHWANYFDLSPSRAGTSDSEFWNIVNSAQTNPSQFAAQLIRRARDRLPAGGTVAEALIDRLRAEAEGTTIDNQTRVALFQGINIAADGLSELLGEGGFFSSNPMTRLAILARALLRTLPSAERTNAFLAAILEGSSLMWVSYLVRNQLFAHGRIGDRRDADRAIVPEEAIQEVVERGLERARRSATDGSLAVVSKVAYPLLLWRDTAGTSEEARAWVEAYTRENEAFLDFLWKMRQQVNSTAGDYFRIDRELLADFLDVSTAERRLETLSQGQTGVQSRAAELLTMLRRRD